jgi:hypothetical protein
MNHVLAPFRRFARRAALAGLAGIVLVALDASAQVGDLGRRARDAAARAQGNQPAGSAVTFDSVTLELTDARLEQVVKGLRAGKTVLDGRRGRPGWNTLAERRDAASNEATALEERHGAAFATFTERHTAVSQCRDVEFDNVRQMRQQETMQRAMADPNLAMRFVELSQAIQAAQARGDTAETNRLIREMEAAFGGATRADSVAVDQKCGRLPAPPPTMVRRDSLRALTDTLNEHLRRLEIEADTMAIHGSGLTGEQMGMARERITMYLAQEEGKHSGFTAIELKALAARRAELVALL